MASNVSLPDCTSGNGHGDWPAEDLGGDGLAVDTVTADGKGHALCEWLGSDSDNLGDGGSGGDGGGSRAGSGGGSGRSWVALSILGSAESAPVGDRDTGGGGGSSGGWGSSGGALGGGGGDGGGIALALEHGAESAVVRDGG